MFGRYKQRAHFRCNYLFLENGPFLCPFKVTKHYKNRGFSRHKGKPQMALLLANVPFWEGGSKGGFTICDTKKLCSAENTIFYSVFSKTQLADMKECNLKKTTKFTKNKGLFAKMPKSCCFCQFFCFLVVLSFFPLCFCACVLQKAQKGYFPAILEVFKFCSPEKAWSLKSFFSSYSVFFLVFLFVFPFKIPFLFFVHQPPFRKHYYFGFLSFLFSCLFLS